MTPYDLVIFDADGTLRRCTVPGQPCPNAPGEWELIPGVHEVVQGLVQDGVALAIASNQAGIFYRYLSEGQAVSLISDMCLALSAGCPMAWDVYICPHAPDANCACRKPQPGMLFSLMVRAEVGPSRTLFVGDMESDREAAERAGCAFMWARDFFEWED